MRNIEFDITWNQSTIRNLVKNNPYQGFANHEDLSALCIAPYAEDEECYVSDYEELTYIVPKKWLKKTVREIFGVSDLTRWLQSYYTSEESEVVFERALNERQVVMVDFR